jgi:hypothetical protein
MEARYAMKYEYPPTDWQVRERIAAAYSDEEVELAGTIMERIDKDMGSTCGDGKALTLAP